MPEPTYKIADLCDAATDGDAARIVKILDAQPDLINVHLAENDEHRGIHFAIIGEHEGAVRVLVERGTSIDQGIYPHRDATGPMTMAEERGLDRIVSIIRDETEKLQLAACQNISISEENDALFERVRSANDSAAIELLDKHPELLNACHRNGGSVLYTAASGGRNHLVMELLQRGADFSHLTPDGASPLDGAVHNIRGGDRPLNKGCLIAAGILLQAGCKASLETSVALDDEDRVRAFAKEHPDRFQNDGTKRLGLLLHAVQADNREMVKLLLELGCHPDDRHKLLEYETQPESWGHALWHAAGEGQHEIAEILLEAGADPNASNYASGTPVSRAYNSRDEKMKGLLLRYGGVLEALFAALEGESAAAAVYLQNDANLAEELLWAAGCGGEENLAGLCLRRLDWKSDDLRWLRILEQPIRQWRLQPHRKFKDVDRTVYPRIFRMILEHGADPNVVGRYGYRLAHQLAACGSVWHEVIMTEEERVEFATFLLDHGARLDVIDDLLQSTPLGWAVRWGRYELARLYLERGADPNLANADWATPLAWANKNGNSEIRDLIERHLQA